MDLILLQPGDSPAADAIATWNCEGVTLQLTAAGSGGAGRTFAVRELRALGEAAPAHLQVALFEGPRDERQQAADSLADRRIWPVAAEVPGMAGAIVAVAAGGARLIVQFADRPDVFGAVLQRIFATELLPDEDPALLTGPTAIQRYVIHHATHTLRDVPSVAVA